MSEKQDRIEADDFEYTKEHGHRPLSDQEKYDLENRLGNHPDVLRHVLGKYGATPTPKEPAVKQELEQKAAWVPQKDFDAGRYHQAKREAEKPKFITHDDNPFWTMDRNGRERIMDLMEGHDVEDVEAAVEAVDTGVAWDPDTDERVALADVGVDMAESAVAFREATSRDGVSERCQIDTGRYLQVEFRSKPGIRTNVYESVPVGNMHEFWNMDAKKGTTQVSCCELKDVRIIGVYEGQPFQARRDEYQAGFEKNMGKPSPMARLNRLAADLDNGTEEKSEPEY